MKRLFTLSQSIFSNSECLCTSRPAIRLTTTYLPQYAADPGTWLVCPLLVVGFVFKMTVYCKPATSESHPNSGVGGHSIGVLPRLRNQWDMHDLIIDTFATLLVSSYVKLLGVLMDLLAPVQVWGVVWVWDVVGNVSGVFRYYEPRIELFCKEHIPLGLFTIFINLRFNMLHLVHPTFVSTSCGVHSKVYRSKMPNSA